MKLKKKIEQLKSDLNQKVEEIDELKDKLKQKVKEKNELKSDLNQKVDELKSYLNQKVEEINGLKSYLNQKVEKFKSQLANLKKDNNSLYKENEKLKEELNNQNNISLILKSYDEGILFSIICKKTDEFSKIKKILDRKYPELKNNKKIFKKNGNIIDQEINLGENNIQDGDTIIFI